MFLFAIMTPSRQSCLRFLLLSEETWLRPHPNASSLISCTPKYEISAHLGLPGTLSFVFSRVHWHYYYSQHGYFIYLFLHFCTFPTWIVIILPYTCYCVCYEIQLCNVWDRSLSEDSFTPPLFQFLLQPIFINI